MGTKIIIISSKAEGKVIYSTISTMSIPESLAGFDKWIEWSLKEPGPDLKQVKKIVLKPF